MALLIADISSHNVVSSWPAFLGSVDGVICKISEGTGYAWPGAPAALAQIRAAGKLAGAYHYAGSSGTSAQVFDPTAEADYFLAHYAHRPGEVIVLDWEPAHSPADPDAWVYTWCERILARTGVLPMVYMNHFGATAQSKWTKTLGLHMGLWAAWYGADTGAPQPGEPSFAPWSQVQWQYTSKGSRPGISAPLDLSQFYGTADQWRAYGSPGGNAVPSLDSTDLANIAAAVWGLPIGGVNARDRLQGIDSIQLPSIAKAIAGIPTAPPQIDVAALAQRIIEALPAAQAAEVAKAVVDQLGQRIVNPPA